MSKNKEPLEFGPNGAVLNSDGISEELAKEYRKPSEHWFDAILVKPTKWPPSALLLAFGGTFLMGMRFATDDQSNLPIWLSLGPILLIVSAGWWRFIWGKHFDN